MVKLSMADFQRNLNYLYGELKSKRIELEMRKRADAPLGELVNIQADIDALECLIDVNLACDIADCK